MTAPLAAAVRFRVDPADVPAAKAARRLHLTAAEFDRVLPKLLARGFPAPDPDTGHFSLEAIDAWRRQRHPALFGLTGVDAPRNAREVVGDRLARL